MLIEAAKEGEIARGGLRLVRVGEVEIALCNSDGVYYAVGRRCTHENGQLEKGALDGTILTCPLHHVQFDVTNGEVLNYPLSDYSKESETVAVSHHSEVCDIRVYPVHVQSGSVWVAVE